MIGIYLANCVATNNINIVPLFTQLCVHIVLTMYLDRSKTSVHGKTYHRVLLRRSFRQNGKVKHRTIANLSACSQEELQAIELAFQDKHDLDSLHPSNQGPLHLRQGVSFGALWALHQLAERIGLSQALGSDRQGKLALWQVLARAIRPGSRLGAVRLAGSHATCDVLELEFQARRPGRRSRGFSRFWRGGSFVRDTKRTPTAPISSPFQICRIART